MIIDLDNKKGDACHFKGYGAPTQEHQRGQAAQITERCEPVVGSGSLVAENLIIDNCYQITIEQTGKPKRGPTFSNHHSESDECR